MKYTAKIEFNGQIKDNFAAELKELKKERTSYEVREDGKKTVFEIKANDATALKIATSSITKMLEVIEKMERI